MRRNAHLPAMSRSQSSSRSYGKLNSRVCLTATPTDSYPPTSLSDVFLPPTRLRSTILSIDLAPV